MVDTRWVASVGAGLTLAGSFLPWLSSGARARSSYELFAIVDRLGFSPDGWVGVALRWWVTVPLLCVVVVVVHWFRLPHVANRLAQIATAGVVAVYAGTTAAAVRMAPEIGLFRPRLGPWVTLTGAVLLLVSAGLTARRRTDAPSGPEV